MPTAGSFIVITVTATRSVAPRNGGEQGGSTRKAPFVFCSKWVVPCAHHQLKSGVNPCRSRPLAVRPDLRQCLFLLR